MCYVFLCSLDFYHKISCVKDADFFSVAEEIRTKYLTIWFCSMSSQRDEIQFCQPLSRQYSKDVAFRRLRHASETCSEPAADVQREQSPNIAQESLIQQKQDCSRREFERRHSTQEPRNLHSDEAGAGTSSGVTTRRACFCKYPKVPNSMVTKAAAPCNPAVKSSIECSCGVVECSHILRGVVPPSYSSIFSEDPDSQTCLFNHDY